MGYKDLPAVVLVLELENRIAHLTEEADALKSLGASLGSG